MKNLLASFALLISSVAIADESPAKKLPLDGELFEVAGCAAFLIPPQKKTEGRPTPWVWYAPTLPNLPGGAEKWMFERFSNAGIGIAGIDVGESYGSPSGRKKYTVLYEEMTTKRGYAAKPVLLARSRGGLMLLSWAADNPDKVGGIAGIYPVCNLESYPGLEKAAPAHGLTAEALKKDLKSYNPIDRVEPLARAGVPLFAIHGDVDKTVPLEANSALLQTRYKAAGGEMRLMVPPGQGHNMWSGFFECDELVRFVIDHARP